MGTSPEWLANRIHSIGLKSINNIVDAANFVMMDCGHPMHTFDLDNIVGNEIVVRFPKPNEKMKLLDESEIELNTNKLFNLITIENIFGPGRATFC